MVPPGIGGGGGGGSGGVSGGGGGLGGGGGGGGGRRVPAEVPSHIQHLIEQQQQERQAFERGAGLRRPIYRKIVAAGQGASAEGMAMGDYVMPGALFGRGVIL